MIKAHFFDINTLIKIDNKVWIVDKDNPNIPLFKISESDFNLIRNGVYKSQGNKIEYNGEVYYLPANIANKLRVKMKLSNTNFDKIGISMQEFMNREIIDNKDFEINMNVILPIKNTDDDIYIICSSQVKRAYQTIIEEFEEKLKHEGLQIKNFYFISDTFTNRDRDDVNFKVIRLLLQHLIGYKTDNNKFTDKEIERYNTISIYDNQNDTIKIADEANLVLKSLLKNTDDGLRSVIKEDLMDNRPFLIVNQITDNQLNNKITKKVSIEYTNLIKKFDSFRYKS